MQRRFNSILDTIGNTPVIRINHLAPGHVNLYVKLEAANPMGSVKDRFALAVIEDAEQRGELQPGQTIVEATSGNTGIGLAMVCAQKGYPLVVTMAENFSIERRKLLRFLGAKVVLTPASEKGSGMIAKANELALAHGWWQPRQFENPVNARVHEHTTAEEILEAFADIQLDYWVSGFGTAGTLAGVSRTLQRRSPNTHIVVCEPDNSPMLASGIQQTREADGRVCASHPLFRPHLMQGWSTDFIPVIADEAVEEKRIHSFMAVNGNDALKCARDLARREGILVGISAGATFAGALDVARNAAPGSHILCMLPDSGERYMTTALFADVDEDMNESEISISQSTPHHRFDVSANASIPSSPPSVTKEQEVELEHLIHNSPHPVVMFSLEWCEFCWSIRNLFNEYGIEYTSVDLDSAELQQDNRGGQIRAALHSKTGCNTLPQIFINGEFVGGCTDVLDECLDDQFVKRLQQLNIKSGIQIQNPYGFLPKWLHPR